MEFATQHIIIMVVLLSWFNHCIVASKYSAEMNTKFKSDDGEKSFRMNKINILWDKAQKRLGPEKLKNLYSDMKIQDKEEMNLKHLKADGGDKEGLKEAALRKRFKALMDKYDLGEQLQHVEEITSKTHQSSSFNEATDDIAKKSFASEKLNKVWMKAKTSGFSEDELKTLYEELAHHQEKLEEYHQLMDEISADDNYDNSLNRFDETNDPPSSSEKKKSFHETSQLLKDKHKELRNSYDKLTKLTSMNTEGNFEEFRVQELWKLARQAKFSPDELDSLKEELQHYEHRVKKLKHLQSQVDFNMIDTEKLLPEHKIEEKKHVEQRIKQYTHKVDKLHADLESRILQKHLEL